ncbi:MAG: glycoside hydrolase family 76 protein [Prevotellaceae bacterium]|nr:glycoside hydrolase family 76 protein [Prevotellaceae bacterium]
MKIKLIITAAVAAFTLMSCASCGGNDKEPYTPKEPAGNGNGNQPTVVYHQRAKEQFDIVNQLYRMGSAGSAFLYKEELNGNAYSYLWPFDGMISATAALHKLGYEVNYAAMTDNYEKYYRASAGQVNIPGYGSSTNGTSGGGTRFYDDNSIVGIELVEAYKQTQQQRFLDRCAVVYTFLQSGLDNIMGEALWWNEDQRNQPGVDDSNKPACSNGYATNFLLNYHSICPQTDKAAVLTLAKKLYSWMKSTLQDPGDKTYWNAKSAQGHIDQTKWTYNSGVMTLNGILLYQITGEQQYLDEAIATATGAYNYFVKPRNGLPLSYPDHDPWFNTKLLKAYIALAPLYTAANEYVNTYINFINKGYDKARMSNGLFYEDWTGAQQGRYRDLLHQAAVIESYALIAIYKNETR